MHFSQRVVDTNLDNRFIFLRFLVVARVVFSELIITIISPSLKLTIHIFLNSNTTRNNFFVDLKMCGQMRQIKPEKFLHKLFYLFFLLFNLSSYCRIWDVELCDLVHLYRIILKLHDRGEWKPRCVFKRLSVLETAKTLAS